MSNLKTIATICARGGSKGLPRKNILSFAGKPLIAHTIEQAFACPEIGSVYVSTDDEEIAAISKEFGAIVPYTRPAELASDGAGKLPVIEHLLQHLELEGVQIERVVDLQPTSPLRLSEDIQAALLRFDEQQCDLVVSVTEPSHNPYYSLAELNADGMLELCKEANALRRQDVPAAWGLNGAIYVWRRNALPFAIENGFWSISIHHSIMPKIRSIDIDERLDFEIAEWLYQRRNEIKSKEINV